MGNYNQRANFQTLNIQLCNVITNNRYYKIHNVINRFLKALQLICDKS